MGAASLLCLTFRTCKKKILSLAVVFGSSGASGFFVVVLFCCGTGD